MACSNVFANPIEKSSGHLELDSAYLDMGNVKRGTVAEGVMHFRNIGKAPLTILHIYSECGCTVPDYPTDPILPGESGKIIIRFDARNRDTGWFRKTMRIRSDADNSHQGLTIKGNVEEASDSNYSEFSPIKYP